MQTTLSHIALPINPRCRWWQKVFTQQEIMSIDPATIKSGANDLPGPYLKRGQDLELQLGTVLIDGEERHHYHNRGWDYRVAVVRSECADALKWRLVRISEDKAEMKAAGFPVSGSGPVAAAVRLAQFIITKGQEQ